MTRARGDAVGRAAALLARALQAALVGILGYALVTWNAGLVVNAGLPLAIALFPDVVRLRYDYRLHPVLRLWIVTAAFLHAAGALGPYQTYGWYDQVAHGVSASMIAGVGYALVQTIDAAYDTVEVPGDLRFVFVLVFAMAFGVVWEIAEFGLQQAATASGGDALLAQYGLTDVILDFAFNAVGAVLVALWGTSYFEGLRTVFDEGIDGSESGT